MNRNNATTIRQITVGLLAIVMLLGSVADARPKRQRRVARTTTEQRKVVNINKATEDQLQFTAKTNDRGFPRSAEYKGRSVDGGTSGFGRQSNPIGPKNLRKSGQIDGREPSAP